MSMPIRRSYDLRKKNHHEQRVVLLNVERGQVRLKFRRACLYLWILK